MKTKRYHIASAHLAISVLVVASAALALSGENISRWVVAGGGGQSAGGEYTLKGTLGQAEAGSTMSGGGYTLSGGFWGGVPTTLPTIYLPLVQSN